MLNRLFIAIGVLVILAIGAAFVVPRFVQWSDYRDRMEQLASAALGSPVKITGDIQFALLPQPRLEFSKVVVGAEPSRQLKVERVVAEFSLVDFLRDQYAVTRLELNAPQIDIVGGPGGSISAGLQLTDAAAASNVSIARATISGGQINFTQYGAAEPVSLTGIDGELNLETLRGPFSFQGTGTSGGVGYGMRVSIAKADETGATPLSLLLKAVDESFTLSSEGSLTLADAPRYAGTLTLRQPPAKPANGAIADAGRGDLVLEGKLNASGERIVLSDATLSPDENRPGTRLTGAADLTLGAAPRFNAVMSAGVVALPPRDATAETVNPPYELVRLLGEVPLPPIPSLPGKIGLQLEELNLRGMALRNVRLDARTDAHSWQVEQIAATLPGDGTVNLSGNFSIVDGKPIFAGSIAAKTARLDMLAASWRKLAQGNPLFNIGGSLSGDISLSSDTLTMLGGALKIGDVTEAVSFEVGFAPAARRLKLETRFGALTPAQGERLAALLPDVANDASFGATFPKGEVSLGLTQGSLFGIAGRDLLVEATWDGGVLDVSHLSAADYGGAEIDASFTAFGTLAKPELSGEGTLRIGVSTAPVLKALFEALQTPVGMQDALRRQLPADLAIRLEAPTGAGGQTLTVSGTIGAATLGLDARLDAGIVNAMKAPLKLDLEMNSVRPSMLTAQLGLSQGELFPESHPLKLTMTLDGAPTNSLETKLSLTGGEDRVVFSGNIVPTDPAKLIGKGDIEATLGDPDAALTALGAGGVHVPALTAKATLGFTGGELLRLSEIVGQSGSASFTGGLELRRQGERAAVSGSIAFPALDAGALLPMLAGRLGATRLTESVWPDSPIDIGNAERSVTGRVTVTAKQVEAGGKRLLGATSFDFDWDAQGTRVRGLRADMGGGVLTFDGVICCAGALTDKHLTARATLSGVDVDGLLPPGVAAVLGGTIDASAQFDGTGDSLAGIMRAMTGSGSYTVKNFTAEHFDPNAFAAIAGFGAAAKDAAMLGDVTRWAA
ncbi:MAG: AsmA family protein, partial [Devosia sp.]